MELKSGGCRIVEIFRNLIHDNVEMGVLSLSSGTLEGNQIKKMDYMEFPCGNSASMLSFLTTLLKDLGWSG